MTQLEEHSLVEVAQGILATGAVPRGCRWCVTITIMAGVGSSVLFIADYIHRFGTVGDLFSSRLNGTGVHCNVSRGSLQCQLAH